MKLPKPVKRVKERRRIARTTSVRKASAKRPSVVKADAEWSRAVRKRDGGCQLWLLLGDCQGRQEAHHAFFTKKAHPKHRYDLDNGAQLCYHHHHNFAHRHTRLWRIWWTAGHPDRLARLKEKR